ncbi:hypothetical protein ABMY20_09330 [Tenacibaculum sp. SSH1-16]|uniref:hypothetical protein n=1 Tax=Tenacibaculum sp. SSH1-16 TaxID=3136667 RepID=UPI0032C48D75
MHQCLDWSERKHHIAGALGASLLKAMIKKDWLRKKPNSREIIITSFGRIELKNKLNYRGIKHNTNFFEKTTLLTSLSSTSSSSTTNIIHWK